MTVLKTLSITRSRFDIISSMLDSHVALNEVEIIHRYDLDSSEYTKYIEFLVSAGLLRTSIRENKVEILKITEKGKMFLRDYQRIRNILCEDKISRETITT